MGTELEIEANLPIAALYFSRMLRNILRKKEHQAMTICFCGWILLYATLDYMFYNAIWLTLENPKSKNVCNIWYTKWSFGKIYRGKLAEIHRYLLSIQLPWKINTLDFNYKFSDVLIAFGKCFWIIKGVAYV